MSSNTSVFVITASEINFPDVFDASREAIIDTVIVVIAR